MKNQILNSKNIFIAISISIIFIFNVESSNKEDKPPNIVFIMSDDHAVSAVSAYNYWLAKSAPTPNIDRIAHEGMLMNKTFNTNSICGPSRAAILTGKYAHINGFYKNEGGGDFDGSQQTFPKILQNNGYQTAVIGKWHLGTTPTGFDYSKVMINHGGQGTYYNTVFLENGKDTITETKRHSTEQVAYDALKWLDNERDKNKPFMLMYQFKAPHRPWTPNSKFDSLFIEDLPYPETFNDDYEGRLAASENMLEIENHMNRKDLKLTPPKGLSQRELGKWNRFGNNGEFWTPNDTLQGLDLKKWKYQRYIKDYLRCVAGVDESVGKMLDYLKENDLDENTIVIYTSDQGFYLGEHGWFDKRWMYEPSFRMPFMIKYPKKIKSKSVNNELIVNVDFAPTLLDLARALIFLVISCPCALVISIPLGYFGGLGAASKNGILFKGASFLDAMTKINTLVMDKTVFLFRTICPSSTVFMSQPNSSNSLNTVDLHLSHTIFFMLRVCFIILFIVPEMGRAINQPTSISFPYQGIILMFLLGSSYNQ